MTLSQLTIRELKTLTSNRLAKFMLLAFCLMCVYALWNGHAHRQSLSEEINTFVQAQQNQTKEFRQRIVDIEQGRKSSKDDKWAGLAMDTRFPASASPGVLANLSVGVSDVQPHMASVSQWRSLENLFGRYQYQSPLALAAGPIDMAFIIIFLLPIVMIILTYDTLSEPRESGRLELILAQPISLRNLIMARLLAAFVVLVVLVTLLLLIGVAVGGELTLQGSLTAFGLWLMVFVAYFFAWAGVIAFVVSMNKTSESTALILIALWSINGLVGPGIVSALTESLYPSPSRLAFLSEAREATSEAYRSKSDVMQGMLLDHPELTVDNYSIPEYIRTSYLVTRSVDESVRPILTEFDQVQAQRHQFLNAMQYTSPAVLALQAFNSASGTNLSRQKRFEKAAREYKLQLGERIESNVLSGQMLSSKAYDALPRFSFREASFKEVLNQVAGPVVYLLLIGLIACFMATKKLQKLQTRIKETQC